MNMRPPMPPPPSGNPAGDADVAAFLQHALIKPVDEARATRDIALLADAAKSQANVTPLMSRRERTFKQVAAAAAVVVVASGAGFGAAQLGSQNGEPANPDTLAIEDVDRAQTDPVTPPQIDTTPPPPDSEQTDVPADTEPSTPAPAPAPAPSPERSAPPAAPDPTVGDAGDAEAIDEFSRDDVTADTDVCEDDTDEACATDDAKEPADDGTDPRDLLRERRFGAN